MINKIIKRGFSQNNSNEIFKFYSLTAKFIISILLIITASGQTYSQTATSVGGATPAGLTLGKVAGSYLPSDIESVNLFNGSASVAVPLLNVYGRGEAGYTIHKPIKTPQWVIESTLHYLCEEEACPMYGSKALISQYNTPSTYLKEIGYAPGIVEVRRVGTDYQEPGPGIPGDFYARTHTVIVFKTNEGSEITLYDEKQGGNVAYWYYNYDPDRGRVFTARDGSEITFISDEDINDWNNVASDTNYWINGYIKTRNGIVYRIYRGNVQWMRDRNGNTVTFNYVNDRLDKVKDSNGREVKFVYGSGYDQIIYDGAGGADRTIQINYSTIANRFLPSPTYTYGANLFPQMQQGMSSGATTPFNYGIVSTISIPDGRNFEFFYNEYGEIAQVITPTGASTKYTYGGGQGAYPSGQVGNVRTYYGDTPPIIYIHRRLKERHEFANGGQNMTLKTVYNEDVNSVFNTTVEQFDPVTNEKLAKTIHYFNGSPHTSLSATAPMDSLPDYPLEGKEIKTEYLDVVNNSVLSRVENEWELWGCGGRASCSSPSDPNHWSNQLRSTKTSILDTVTGQYKVAKKDFTYDNYNNLIEVKEYDFGTGQVGTSMLRRSTTTYLYSAQYTDSINSNHMLSLPLQQSIFDGNAIEQSRTTYEYDNYTAGLTTRQGITGYDGTFNTTYRGNVTQITRWLLPNQTISTRNQYDIAGNVVSTTDPRNYTVNIDYSDRYGIADNESRNNSNSPVSSNGSSTYAFPTSVSNPLGHTIYTQYDYYTGKTINSENANGTISKTVYDQNDAFDRPKQSVVAIGTADESQTSYFYNDTTGETILTADINNLNDNLLKSASYRDKLNRVIETRKYLFDNTYISTRTQYDALGREKQTSNPFKQSTPVNEIRWTKNQFDSLGRINKVIFPDETTTTDSDNPVVLTSYIGNAKIVTDQSGRKRKGVNDALNRTVQVIEDPAGQNLTTDYVFDALNNVRKTTQGVQTRYFLYDSLGRIIRSRQPEQGTNAALVMADASTGNNQWSAGYNYDNNGNIQSITDARGIVITGTYDALNRITSRDYSDLTPDISFVYDDPSIQYSKGTLTKTITGDANNPLSVTSYTKLNSLTKVMESTQTTDGREYQMGYFYNLSGNVIAERYPSGKIIRNDYQKDGNLSKISGLRNGLSKTMASDFIYNAAGFTERMRFGNGRWENTSYNSRLQITQIGLGTGANDASLFETTLGYGADSQNNGAVREQQINFAGLNQPIVQTYNYDTLNRLQSSTEINQGNPSVIWKQVFNYDRFGNRTLDELNTTTLDKNCPVTSTNPHGICQREAVNPQINSANNKFDDGQGYSYDNAGNLIADPTGKLFAYDAENRQRSFGTNPTANNGGVYLYDGNGKRIKKIIPNSNGNIETVFIYNAFGVLVAEYENVESVAKSSTLYLTEDHLGTPRIITNEAGEVTSRHDYTAFGEEIYAGVGSRTLQHKYSSLDNIRQQFTGYERDSESGLDYAVARYYNNRHGRFTSVDPLTASATIKNPQSFNRYSYALNNPYKFTDPLGLVTAQCDPDKEDCPPGTQDPPDPPILKYPFNFKGLTYTYTPKKTEESTSDPATGLIFKTERNEETDQRDFVPTGDKVNEALSKYQAAVYVNEVEAESAKVGIEKGKGTFTLKELELGISADFGIKGDKGIGVSPNTSAKFEVNSTESVEAARISAGIKLEVSVRNELRALDTVATGSGGKPRKLTEGEITGLINAAKSGAVKQARADVSQASNQ